MQLFFYFENSLIVLQIVTGQKEFSNSQFAVNTITTQMGD